MIILGLTGSIAMGKSTVARQFQRLGAAICDSDRIVHHLLAAKGEAVSEIARHFPQSLKHNAIDRKVLSKLVFGNPGKLRLLECILHPIVRKKQQYFIRQARKKGKELIVMDIPLLFETDSHRRCDYTVVVSSPAFIQRQRVMQRPGMTQEKLRNILARQMPDAQKRKRADFIIHTGLGKYASLKQVKQILRRIR